MIASGTCGDNLTWTLDEEGTLTISGAGEMEDYTWSSRAIWSKYSAKIRKAIICQGVTSIGDSAFWDCGSLTSVVIPDGVTSIGDGAFHGCGSLTSLVIPEGVTSIKKEAFPGGLFSSLTYIYYAGSKSEWNKKEKYNNSLPANVIIHFGHR